MSMSCCMCEPMETAQSLGDDTHAVATTAKVGRRARTAHRVMCSLVSVGCKPGPSIRARDKDAGERECETPTPCATYRQREKKKEKREKEQEKVNRKKGKKEKNKKEKNAVCRNLRLALCGWLSKALRDLDGKASLHDHACGAVRGQPPRTGALLSRKPKSDTARASSSGSRRRQRPQRNPFFGDAAAPAAAAPAATTVPAMPSATELSYLRLLAGRPLAEAAANCVRSPPLPPWPPPTVVALRDLP